VQLWYRYLARDKPFMVIPPYLPANATLTRSVPPIYASAVHATQISSSQHFNIVNLIFLGPCAVYSSPGVFVRMASILLGKVGDAAASESSLRQQHKDGTIRLHFTMQAGDDMDTTMRALVDLHQLNDEFTFIDDDSVERIVAMLQSTKHKSHQRSHFVLVDPSPTLSSHASGYLLATHFDIPIVRFCSSSSNEWLLSPQQLNGRCVADTTVESLALTVQDYILSISSVANLSESEPFTAANELIRTLYSEQVSALAVHVYLHQLIQGIGRKHEHLLSQFEDDGLVSWNPSKFGPALHIPQLHPALIEPPAGSFAPNSFHRLHLASCSLADSLEYILKLVDDSSFVNGCLDFDKYRIIQSLLPRIKYRLLENNECVDKYSDQSVLNTGSRNGKLLCIVYTHATRHMNVHAQLYTFGKRCDGFVSFSEEADERINAIKVWYIIMAFLC
jgi:hypothetical protein